MKFTQWLEEFFKDKKLVIPADPSAAYAVHSARRFVDKNNQLWEIAITYTDRVVVRTGTVSPDGITIKWTDWVTQHDVEIE